MAFFMSQWHIVANFIRFSIKYFDTRQKLKICYKICVCYQLTEKMLINGRRFAGRHIQIIHFLMVSSACMDS